jgi:hypothetical protein
VTIGDQFSRLGADCLTFRPPRAGSEGTARRSLGPCEIAPQCDGAVFCYALSSYNPATAWLHLRSLRVGMKTDHKPTEKPANTRAGTSPRYRRSPTGGATLDCTRPHRHHTQARNGPAVAARASSARAVSD